MLPWKKTKNPHPPNLNDLETEKKDTIAGKNGFPTPRNVVLCEHSQKIIRKKKNSSNRHSLHNPILRYSCDLAEKVVLRKEIVLFFLARPYLLLKKIKKRWPDDRKFPQKITNKSTKTEK